MMRRHTLAGFMLAAVLLLVPIGVAAAAVDPVTEVDWSGEQPLTGDVVDGEVLLDVESGVYPILVLDRPPLSGGDIVVSVEVTVEDVASPGYLELWAVYDDGGRFFSRSFDNAGVGLLRSGAEGTVELPFFLSGTVPAALELNVVLPDGGSLRIGSVALIESGGGPVLVDGDGWWSAQAAGLIGGLAGSAVGVFGAVLGTLAGRGRARRFVVGSVKAGAATGVVLVAVGFVALAVGQPFEVWLLLLLFGIGLAAVFGAVIRTIGVRYEVMELQRMRARDLVSR